MGNASFGDYVQFPIFNALIPKEGPKAIPYVAQFGTVQSYTLDFQGPTQRGVISMIQTVYIDNSLNSKATTVTAVNSGMVVTIAPYSQGFYPILTPNPPKFTVYSTGTANVGFMFLNVPVTSVQWASNQQNNVYDTNGYLYTDDANLATAIAGGYVKSKNFKNGSGDVVKPDFNGNVAYSGSIGTSTTAAVTIVTGAPSFYLTNMSIQVDTDATIGTAGDFVVTVMDGATTVCSNQIELQTTAVNQVGNYKVYDVSGLQYNSSGPSQALTIAVNVPLLTGALRYNFFGGLTSTSG